jgi:hypothetical protein
MLRIREQRGALLVKSRAPCMIDWLVGYALRKRLVVAMICAFASIYGIYSFTQLAIEPVPRGSGLVP